jgi:hypothetical protein
MKYEMSVFHVMEWKDIKTIAPAEAATLEALLKMAGITVADMCLANELDDWGAVTFAVDDDDALEALIDDIEDAWTRLAESFAKATMVDGAGLEVEPHRGEFNEEPGQFDVKGAFRVTPPGSKASAGDEGGLKTEPCLEHDPAGFVVSDEYCMTPAGEAFAGKIGLRVFLR